MAVQYDFEELNKRGGQAFLDTGTTFVYVSKPFYAQIVSTFSHFCKQSKGNCGGNKGYQECYKYIPFMFRNDDDFMNTFPVFDFQFEGGAVVKWFPQDYFVGGPENEGYKCIGIKVLKDMILGALFMRNYDVSFEKNSKSITFVRSNCGKTTGDLRTEGLLDQKVKVDTPNKKHLSTLPAVQEAAIKGTPTQSEATPAPPPPDPHSTTAPPTVSKPHTLLTLPQQHPLLKQTTQSTDRESKNSDVPTKLKEVYRSRKSKHVSEKKHFKFKFIVLLFLVIFVAGFLVRYWILHLHRKLQRGEK